MQFSYFFVVSRSILPLALHEHTVWDWRYARNVCMMTAFFVDNEAWPKKSSSYITDHYSANTTKPCLKKFVIVELCTTSISDVTFTTFDVTSTYQTQCCCCGGREGKRRCRAIITNEQFCLQSLVSKPLWDKAHVTLVWNCVFATKSTFLVFTILSHTPTCKTNQFYVWRCTYRPFPFIM